MIIELAPIIGFWRVGVSHHSSFLCSLLIPPAKPGLSAARSRVAIEVISDSWRTFMVSTSDHSQGLFGILNCK